MLFVYFPRQPRAKFIKKLPRIIQLRLPVIRIDTQQFLQRPRRQLQSIQRQSTGPGHITNGRLTSHASAFHALQNPLQHANIFAITRPQKFSVRATTKPVHMKIFGGCGIFLPISSQ